jgi:hypothetical protein
MTANYRSVIIAKRLLLVFNYYLMNVIVGLCLPILFLTYFGIFGFANITPEY